MVMVTNSIVVSDGDLGNTFEGRDHEELNLGSVAGVTDRGIRHDRNEDAFALATAETPAGPAVIAVVCDGVSSADRPDEASLEAARAAVYDLAEAAQAGADLAAASRQAIESARDAVIGLSEDPEETRPPRTFPPSSRPGRSRCAGWGIAAPTGCRPGPSPWPSSSPGTTRSPRRWWRRACCRRPSALESPQAHVVTRWIGIGAREAEPHVEQFIPPGRGALLVCSDGLWNYDPDGGKLATLAMPTALDNPRAAATALLLFALEGGGVDNITVAVVPYPLAGSGGAPPGVTAPPRPPGPGLAEADGHLLEPQRPEHARQHRLRVLLRFGQQRARPGRVLDLLLRRLVDRLLVVRVAGEEVPDPVGQALLPGADVGVLDGQHRGLELRARQRDRHRRCDRSGVPGPRGLLQPEQLDRLLPHLDLPDLPGHGHRELVGHVHVTGDLVVRDLSRAELPHARGVERVHAIAHPQPRHQLLAVLRVRHPDDLRVQHVRVAVQQFLDSRR